MLDADNIFAEQVAELERQADADARRAAAAVQAQREQKERRDQAFSQALKQMLLAANLEAMHLPALSRPVNADEFGTLPIEALRESKKF